MVTTIQISDELKKELAIEKQQDTYEVFLRKLLRQKQRFQLAEEMKEYGKTYAKESLEEVKEWEHTDLEWE